MNSRRRLRVPILLGGVVAALLLFVASASAETRTGESASPIAEGTPDPEVTLVKGSASYDTASGSIRFDLTTAAPPQEEPGDTIFAALASVPGECSLQVLTAYESNPGALLPYAEIITEYTETTALGILVSNLVNEPVELPATKAVSGATTTLTLNSSAVVEKGFNCALVRAVDSSEENGTLLGFPISAPPPPPAPAPAAPTPAPAAFSLATLNRLTLKPGKKRTVKVKVTNTGATATAQGSLRVKGAKGVLVKPERQKLPALTPGTSWTLTFRVQLTAKAKKKSKLHLTVSASGAKVKRSLVIKRKNGAVKHKR